MCKDCDSDHHHRHGHHMGHHWHSRGYSSIVKRSENQVNVPSVLLEVADVSVGDFVEISIRKVKKHGKSKHHHHEE